MDVCFGGKIRTQTFRLNLKKGNSIMSNLIQSEGYYKGKILDGGLNESTGGFPQAVLSLVAEEIYDPTTGEYVPADPENNQIMYYGVLFDGRDRETLNSKQLKKITGWDGVSFTGLVKLLVADVPIQFRVEPHTYNEVTTLQVAWIDEPGASPVRGVQKLDEAGVKALHTKYAALLASTKAPAKAVSAPDIAPKPAVPAHAALANIGYAPAAPPPAYPPPEATLAKRKPGRPAGKPKVPAAATLTGKCTADEAWTEIAALKRDNVSDDQLSEVWVEKIQVVAGNVPEGQITPEQWFLIKQAVLVVVSKV